MKKTSQFILTVIFLLLFANIGSAETKTLVFSTHLKKGTTIYQATFEIMNEAFRRLGYSFKMNTYPGKRALIFSNNGTTDGEAHRIYGIVDNYPNLVRIPEIQQIVYNYAYSIKPIDLNNGWRDLAQYNVAVQRGSVYVTNKANENAKSVTEMATIDNGVDFVTHGRADIVIGTPGEIYDILQRPEYAIYKFKRIEPPLTALPIFTYLHKKHSSLVSLVAQSLHEMKMDGTHKKIMQRLNILNL